MCQFFSAIVFRSGAVRFCELDSHEELISRLELRDDDLHLRGWVRVELVPEGEGWRPITVDETSTPAWWDAEAVEWAERVRAVAERVRPAWAQYEAVVRPARAQYEAVEQSARAQYEAVVRPAWAQCEAVVRPARAQFEAVEQSAWAQFEAVVQSARAQFEAVEQSAWAQFEAVERPARAQFEAVVRPARAQYIDAIRTIEGYVPPKG